MASDKLLFVTPGSIASVMGHNPRPFYTGAVWQDMGLGLCSGIRAVTRRLPVYADTRWRDADTICVHFWFRVKFGIRDFTIREM